jgi:hypothetical protein
VSLLCFMPNSMPRRGRRDQATGGLRQGGAQSSWSSSKSPC